MTVISRQDLVIAMMNKEDFKNEKLYLTTMHIAKEMLSKNIISDIEYHQIDTIFNKKYNPTLGTLFVDIDLN